MTIDDAQADIRRAFVGGGPGAIVSALVWLFAAFVHSRSGVSGAFIALFFGGFLIFPVSLLLSRYVFGRSTMAKGNPLGLLALESTIAMIGCLIAAWLLLKPYPGFAFPVAAIAVGTHYLAFKTAYGDRTYWLLGALLTMIGACGIYYLPGRTSLVILAVAATELAFGMALLVRALKEARASVTAT